MILNEKAIKTISETLARFKNNFGISNEQMVNYLAGFAASMSRICGMTRREYDSICNSVYEESVKAVDELVLKERN